MWVKKMIALKDVSFKYHNKITEDLFYKLNLEIKPGTICGLLGKNGAGKTTLLRLICGLLFPQSGNCKILGYEPRQRLPQFLREIYFIPEEFYVPAITGDLYINLFGAFYPHFSRENCLKFLQEFELPINKNLVTLSYGQKKKFLLAFAFATNCKLLLLDEPTNGLDIPSKGQFRKLLTASFDKQRTIVISTHQVRDLQNMLDAIVIVEKGKIIFNHALLEVANKLTFATQSELLAEEKRIYSEKTLGGYLVVKENDKNDAYTSEIDLEILFNMVIDNAAKINYLLEA